MPVSLVRSAFCSSSHVSFSNQAPKQYPQMSKPHLLRGENKEHHNWIFDRLPEGTKASDIQVSAVSRNLQMNLQDQNHSWELPLDVDLQHNIEATLKNGKLTLKMVKKPHEDSPEELARIHREAMADNRMQQINVREEAH